MPDNWARTMRSVTGFIYLITLIIFGCALTYGKSPGDLVLTFVAEIAFFEIVVPIFVTIIYNVYRKWTDL